MKKIVLFGFTLFVLTQCFGQTLISYGPNTISKEEFLKAYNKNNTSGTNREKAIREYINLYTNFKLKVKEAYALHLDTLQQIKYDVENFRNQIADNYLNDEKGVEKLEEEAFDRSQKDIHALHFMIPTPPGTDTLRAHEAAIALYNKLLHTRDDAGAVSEISEQVMPAKWADLGYLTVFNIPYEYENVLYNTPIGKLSMPFKMPNGWHILKPIAERPAVGKWRIAQILFSVPDNAPDYVKAAIQQKADSVYHLIQNGMNFALAAKAFSDDKTTYLAEGELPEFGTGKYSNDFMTPVMALQKINEVSKPFKTSFGYHIIKLLGKTPVVTDKKDLNNKAELRRKVSQDSRINAAKEKFTNSLITLTGLKPAKEVTANDLYRYADSLMINPTEEYTMHLPISNKSVLKFKDGVKITGADWLKFVRDYKSNYQQYKGETNAQLWDKFINYSAVQYYKGHLEKYNADFNFQVNEFKEGNLLFEIMERNVWGKASTDTEGLKKYYADHKEKYKWEESAAVLIFNCSTEALAKETMAALKAGKNWRSITDENINVQADSSRYDLSQIDIKNTDARPPIGTYSPITVANDGTASFVKYIQYFTEGQQRSFEEAKGLVINDYQNQLEQNWLAALKKKYPVKVNEKIVKQMIK